MGIKGIKMVKKAPEKSQKDTRKDDMELALATVEMIEMMIDDKDSVKYHLTYLKRLIERNME